MGWKLENNSFIPTPTTLEVASSMLLNMIRCNCKLITKNPCSCFSCSCKKNGLSCVASCGNCHGYGCCNVDKTKLLNDSDSELSSEDEEAFGRNLFDLFAKV